MNLMLTFLVSGLWHGAGWTYVIWGGLHGLYQVAGDLTKPLKARIQSLMNVNSEAESFRAGQALVTFLLSGFAWIFFRAGSMKEAVAFLKMMFLKWNPWTLFDGSLFELGLDRVEVNVLWAGLLLLLFADIIRERKKENVSEFLMRQNIWFRWIVLAVFIVGCAVYGVYGVDFDSTQFIYFNF